MFAYRTQHRAEQVRAEYSLGHVKVEVGKDWIQEFLTCQLSTTLRKIDAKNMAAKSQRTKKITMTDKKNSSNQHSTTFCDAFYTFSNFSCMLLNSYIFFPIWILIVLIYQIWETSRNKSKMHSVTKNCSDLSLFE